MSVKCPGCEGTIPWDKKRLGGIAAAITIGMTALFSIPFFFGDSELNAAMSGMYLYIQRISCLHDHVGHS